MLAQIEAESPAIKEINHPARVLIVGKSLSGKTTLAVKIIQYLMLKTKFKAVMLCSPTSQQKTWNPIRHLISWKHSNLGVFLTTAEKMINKDNEEEEVVHPPRLMILDDISFDKKLNEGSSGFLNGIAYDAAHWNITLIVICHRVTNVGAGVRENCDYLVLFQTINAMQMKCLAENYSPTGNVSDFKYLFRQIVSKPLLTGSDKYPFMFMCFKEGTRMYYKFSHKINFAFE